MAKGSRDFPDLARLTLLQYGLAVIVNVIVYIGFNLLYVRLEQPV